MAPEPIGLAGGEQLLKLRFSWWAVAAFTALGVFMGLIAYHGWQPATGRFSRMPSTPYRGFMGSCAAVILAAAARFTLVPAIVIDLTAGEARCRFIGAWSRRVPVTALRAVADGWAGLPAVEIAAGAIRSKRILIPCRLADYRAADRVLQRG